MILKDRIMNEEKHVIALEVLKLMVQAAWADNWIVEEEVRFIQKAGVEMGLAKAEIDAIVANLNQGEGKLPAPNLGLLRKNKEMAMEAMRLLLAADLHLPREEKDFLEQVEELLS
jgi:hypothetical protein